MSWSSYVNHIVMHDMALVIEHKKSPGRCLLRSGRMSQEPSKFFFLTATGLVPWWPLQKMHLHSDGNYIHGSCSDAP